MSTKKQLKAAKKALAQQDYPSALSAAEEVLSHEPTNYHALVFAGMATVRLAEEDGELTTTTTTTTAATASAASAAATSNDKNMFATADTVLMPNADSTTDAPTGSSSTTDSPSPSTTGSSSPRMAAAVEYYTRATRAQMDLPQAWQGLFELYTLTSNFDGLHPVIDALLPLLPDSPPAKYPAWAAVSLALRRQWEAALATWADVDDADKAAMVDGGTLPAFAPPLFALVSALHALGGLDDMLEAAVAASSSGTKKKSMMVVGMASKRRAAAAKARKKVAALATVLPTQLPCVLENLVAFLAANHALVLPAALLAPSEWELVQALAVTAIELAAPDALPLPRLAAAARRVVPRLTAQLGAIDASSLTAADVLALVNEWATRPPAGQAVDATDLTAALDCIATALAADASDAARVASSLDDCTALADTAELPKPLARALTNLGIPHAYIAVASRLPVSSASLAASLYKSAATAAERLAAAYGSPAAQLLATLQLSQARELINGPRPRPAAAIAPLTAALAAGPHPEALALLASAHYTLGHFADAAPLLAQIAEPSPAELEALGWSHYQLGELPAASDALAASVAAEPGRASAQLRLGIVYLERGGDFATEAPYAQTALLKAARLDASSADAFHHLGRFYAPSNPDKAMRCFKKALALEPDHADAASALAAILLAADDMRAVIDLAHHTLAQRHDPKWAHRLVGLDLLAQLTHPPAATGYTPAEEEGLLLAAMPHLQRALRIDPDDAQLWETLAFAYWRSGKYAAALKVVSHLRESPGLGSDLARFIEASLCAILDMRAQAETVFASLLRDAPDFAPGLLGYASFLITAARRYTASPFAPQFAAASAALTKAADLARTAAVLVPTLVLPRKLLGDAALGLARIVKTSDATTAAAQLRRASRAYATALRAAPGTGMLWHDLAVASGVEEPLAAAAVLEPSAYTVPAARGVLLAATDTLAAQSALAEATAKAGRVPDVSVASNLAVVGALNYAAGMVDAQGVVRQLAAVQVADPESSLPWTLRAAAGIECSSVTEVHKALQAAALAGVRPREAGFYAHTLEPYPAYAASVLAAGSQYLKVAPNCAASHALVGRQRELRNEPGLALPHYMAAVAQARNVAPEVGGGLVLNAARAAVAAGAPMEALALLDALDAGTAVPGYTSVSVWPLRLRGLALYHAGRHQEAIAAYQAAYAGGRPEEQADVAVELAKVAFALDNVPVATQYLELVLSSSPQHVLAAATLAEILACTGAYEKAQAMAARLRGTGQSLEPAGYVLMANIAAAAGDARAASRFVQYALHVDPSNAGSWNALAKLWMHTELGQAGRAVRVVAVATATAAKLPASRSQALEQLSLAATARLHRGLSPTAGVRYGDVTALRAALNEAYSLATRMVRLDPESWHAWLVLATALRARAVAGCGEPLAPGRVRATLDRACQLASQSRGSQQPLALTSMALASHLLTEYVATDSCIPGLLQEGVNAASVALGVYGQESPQAAPAMVLLGRARLMLGDVAAARESLLAALRVDPQHMRAWEALGTVYGVMGAPAAAEKAFRQAMRFAQAGAGRVVPLLRAVLVHLQAGDLDAARGPLKEAVKREKKSPLVALFKGAVLLGDGQGQQAREALQTALAANAGLEAVVDGLL
ncbi:uncharacterized protein AMSG_09750 [Thecamonas trahens ATCC 50062]|uniref:Uncharacterized protein n=1 Tax=Thecamonas trahens ATCC 50062 TaxID=461836 RepID=A0A0L0DPA6_THETB|nr:hypothetical protein AMSG_09750 [Thecamonas trahens ATCC 50062]KNC54085.1 hypothetical protein AMSG_09750 [Thecamonas trahens ATCC 50062]|eukprot:XP_013754094.1 hypothetical protein AMSG_09750 [Thecamonas trahens ATCC 50062]